MKTRANILPLLVIISAFFVANRLDREARRAVFPPPTALLTVNPPIPVQEVPRNRAHRTAEGWGAQDWSTCLAKPIVIHTVTTLASVGQGSFDTILLSLSDSNFDIIKFAIGGIHDHNFNHGIDFDCVWLMGQSAPGDGFVMQGATTQGHLHVGNVDNVLITGISLRGDDASHESGQTFQAIGSNPDGIRHIYLDHISSAFQKDQFLLGNYEEEDSVSSEMTVANSIIGADLDGPGFNFARGQLDGPVLRMSGFNNFLAELRYRAPLIGSCIQCEWYENLSYNWSREGMIFKDGNDFFSSQSTVDIVRNHWKPGPRGAASKVIQVWTEDPPSLQIREPQLYMLGNISDNISTDPNDDQKQLVTYRGNQSGQVNDSLFKSTKRVSGQMWPITKKYESTELLTQMLATVGNSWRLSCGGGRIYDRRDAIDDTLVAHAQNNTGDSDPVYTSTADLGGIPSYSSGLVCPDTDGDGLPDAFESWSGLTENDELFLGYTAITLYGMGDSAWIAESQSLSSNLPAFPECVGPGCSALNTYRNNGIRKKYVTSLGNTGAGTLSDKLDEVIADYSDPNKPLDIILFKVAGDIEWSGGTRENVAGVYIAGQSAPGNVVIGQWAAFKFGHSNDIVIRGLGFTGARGAVAQDIIAFYSTKRAVFDRNTVSHFPHRGIRVYSDSIGYSDPVAREAECSRYWSFSRNVFGLKSRYRNTDSGLDPAFTVSDPPTYTMSSGLPRGTHCTTDGGWFFNLMGGPNAQQASSYRLPAASGEDIWVHQNYILEWGGTHGISMNNKYEVDITWNFFDATWNTDPITSSGYWYIGVDSLGACTDDELPGVPCLTKSAYVSHNHSSRNSWGDVNYTQDQIWRGVSTRFVATYTQDSTSAPLDHRRTDPLAYNYDHGHFDTLAMEIATFDSIRDDAGGGFRIDAKGKPYQLRDEITERIRSSVASGTRDIRPGDLHRDSFRLVYFPDFTANNHAAYTDTDADDLPDEFELACSGSTTALAWDGDISGDGYSNLEEYLNGTNYGERLLQWEDNSSGETGFEIWRSLESDPTGPKSLYATVGPDVETYTDPSSFPGAEYQVRAISESGSSDFSNEAVATCR